MIELQDLDLQLTQLDHQAKNLPVLKALAQAQEGHDSHQVLAIASATEKSDIEVELHRSESDVEQVVSRIAKDQQYVDSGTASAKDLQNLLGELESLNRRKQELEEVELEIMVRIDEADSRRQEHERERERFAAEVDKLSKERDAALAEIDVKRSEISALRESVVSSISPELMALYQKIRESSGGIGAARLKDGKCDGCHLNVNTVELTRIKALPEDELVRCEECRRILVRV